MQWRRTHFSAAAPKGRINSGGEQKAARTARESKTRRKFGETNSQSRTHPLNAICNAVHFPPRPPPKYGQSREKRVALNVRRRRVLCVLSPKMLSPPGVVRMFYIRLGEANFKCSQRDHYLPDWSYPRRKIFTTEKLPSHFLRKSFIMTLTRLIWSKNLAFYLDIEKS